jgi:hypothetical protein
MTSLLLVAAAVASLSYAVATVLPARHSAAWLIGAHVLAAILIPAYAHVVLWLGLVVGFPVWAHVIDRRRNDQRTRTPPTSPHHGDQG